MPKIRELLTNFIENLINFLTNQDKTDNNCYIIFNAEFDEILTGLSPTLQEKILAVEYIKSPKA
jgi:hypothetical protein